MREWLPTASINMTVQSSELSLSGFDATPCLNVMCNLTSIARGRLTLKVKPASDAIDGQIDGGEDIPPQGRLDIFVDRAVMDGEIILPVTAFDRLCRSINLTRARPVALTLALSENLSVSVEGDLKIADDMTLNITDFNWTLPLS
ncbi:MAG: hypothetical protein VXV84_04945 [Pseudomonadota bacterium]|nr:hypothetical protein [Pseudomonadota bacterium]